MCLANNVYLVFVDKFQFIGSHWKIVEPNRSLYKYTEKAWKIMESHGIF